MALLCWESMLSLWAGVVRWLCTGVTGVWLSRLEERNRQRAQQVATEGEVEEEGEDMEVEEEEEESKPSRPPGDGDGDGVTPRGGVRDGKKGVWAVADEEDDDERRQGVSERYAVFSLRLIDMLHPT